MCALGTGQWLHISISIILCITASWQELTTAAWSVRRNHQAVVLPHSDTIVLTGGITGNNPFSDTWRSTNGGGEGMAGNTSTSSRSEIVPFVGW